MDDVIVVALILFHVVSGHSAASKMQPVIVLFCFS